MLLPHNVIEARDHARSRPALPTRPKPTCRALLDFIAQQPGDLGFKLGDLIEIVDSSDTWWSGIHKTSRLQGTFPGNFVQVIVSGEYKPMNDDATIYQLFRAIEEVVSSELKFVVDLLLALHAFFTPIENKDKTLSDRLFANSWTSMATFHVALLEELVKTLPSRMELEKEFAAATSASTATPITSRLTLLYDRIAFIPDAELGAFLRRACVECDGMEEKFVKLMQSSDVPGFTKIMRAQREKLLCDWAVGVSDVFVRLASLLKVSNAFIANYPLALETLESSSTDKLAFIKRLEENPLLKGLKLRDFLIKPVQRVCKYGNLMSEIIKNLPVGTASAKESTQRAFNKLGEVSKQVNAMMKTRDIGNAKRLQEIKALVRPVEDFDIYGLNDPSCSLRREGSIGIEFFSSSAGAPEANAMNEVVERLKRSKPNNNESGGTMVRAVLLTDSLLLLEEYRHFLNRRLSVVQAFDFSHWSETIAEPDPLDDTKFMLRLQYSQSGIAKGAWLLWVFSCSLGARDAWVSALNDAFESVKASKKRETKARDLEKKKISKRYGTAPAMLPTQQYSIVQGQLVYRGVQSTSDGGSHDGEEVAM